MPALAWGRSYQRAWLRGDLIAALTLWGATVPMSFAYAQMAGMPPVTGLYSAFFAMLLYGLLSTSHHVKVTASSTMSVMSAAAIGAIATGDTHYMLLSSALALTVGLIMLLAGFAKLGIIADFMAKPVVTGFVFGLAINIIISQTGKLLGIRALGDTSVEQFAYLLTHLGETHRITLAIGLGTILLILACRRWLPKLPAPLIALAIGILVSIVLNLAERGVSVVGEIPTELPSFVLPQVTLQEIVALVTAAVGIVFLAVGESLGTARAFATRYNYPIDANQELIAIGVANVGSGLFQGFTVDASMSTTATADASGAKTQLASIGTAVLLLLTILFLAPLFYSLPNAVLGAIVIMSVVRLIDVGEMRRFYRVRRWDFWVAVVAAVGVLVSSVLGGLVLAVLLSLAMIIYRTSHPHLALLARSPTSGLFGDIERHPDYEADPAVLIVRVDESIYFYNVGAITTAVIRQVNEGLPSLRAVILDLRATSELDVASVDMLVETDKDLRRLGLDVRYAFVRGTVIDRLYQAGALEVIDRARLHPNLDSAVAVVRKALADQPTDLGPDTAAAATTPSLGESPAVS